MTATHSTFPVAGDAAVELARGALKSVVQVADGGRGSGSGVVVDRRGLIVTNAHVVRGQTAGVTLHDGTQFDGRVEAREDAVDLAAIRVEGNDLHAIEYGDSWSLRPGQLVLAVGHPLGLNDAVTLGILSRPPSEGDKRELVASNITLNRGNSGGPLLDARRAADWHQCDGCRARARTLDPDPHRPPISRSTRRPSAAHRRHRSAGRKRADRDRRPAGESLPRQPVFTPATSSSRWMAIAVDRYDVLLDGLVTAGVGGTLRLDLSRAGDDVSTLTRVVAKA